MRFHNKRINANNFRGERVLIIKIWLHLCANIQKVFLKFLYGTQFVVGKSVTWRNNFSIMISETGNIEIGDNCFFNNGCSINSNKLVRIGAGTLFGENVKIYDHNHRFRDKKKLIKEQGFSNSEVIIGKNCWIGSNVVILKGTNIGDNSVIGAGCVVSGMIKKNMIVKNENRLKYVEFDN